MLEIGGSVLLLIVWAAVCYFGAIPSAILPAPKKVLFAFGELYFENALVKNVLFSIKLNFLGYCEAIAIALPLGFIIGLFPFFRGLSERYITAIRYLPITAVIGLFIAWFGIDTNMKVQFLAFGIFVYLVSVVVQRVDEVQSIYVDTVRTLGATKRQTITSVFIPDVLSRISDYIRVLIAISWTYIIVAEVMNSSAGGVGALVYISARLSRVD